MSLQVMLPALLTDPILICWGLFKFALSLFIIPVFFHKITEIAISIASFIVYTVHELREYFFPSYHNPQNARNNTNEINDSELKAFLRYIGDLIMNPSKIIRALKNDFNCKNPSHIIIQYKLKFLFFLLATAISSLTCFFPAVAAFIGANSISIFLTSSGIQTEVAKSATIVIVGGLTYALRPLAVGLVILLCNIGKALGKSFNYLLCGDWSEDNNQGNSAFPRSPRESSKDVKKRLLSHPRPSSTSQVIEERGSDPKPLADQDSGAGVLVSSRDFNIFNQDKPRKSLTKKSGDSLEPTAKKIFE